MTGVATSTMPWAQPGIETLADGVHRVPLPLPMDALTAVNVYVVEGDRGLTLIDGGWSIPAAVEELERALATLGYRPGDVEQFLVTHAHRDHYTLAAAWKRRWGATVRVGGGERDYLAAMRSDATGGYLQVRLLAEAGAAWLVPEWLVWLDAQPRASDVWLDPDAWLSGGETFEVGRRTLIAVATPGHTHGHTVFVDPGDGLLFSGDHVLPTITPSVGFQPVHQPLSLKDYLGSLRLLVDSGPDLRLLPAHGPANATSHARVTELLAHHDVRLGEIATTVTAEGVTAADVARRLRWTRRGLELSALEPHNQALAVMECLQHLELLEHEGRVASRVQAGVRRWQPA